MLLIWGFKIRAKVMGTVAFFCPRCGGDRTGLQKTARRWFTFFWIPIIPLKEVGQFVECETCHTTFDPEVLTLPTTTQMGRTLSDATYAITLMMVQTAGQPSAAMKAAAVRDLAVIVPGYDLDRLDREVGDVDPTTADRYVHDLGSHLEVAGKERFLADLVRLGRTDGDLNDAQRRLISDVGRGLGLTSAHITGVVDTAVPRPADTPDHP
jgi:hypothetical protein